MGNELREKIEALSLAEKSMLAELLERDLLRQTLPIVYETPEQKEARLNAFERDMLPVRKPKQWKLNRVNDIEWIADRSGVTVLISWDALTDSVRLDIMALAIEPLQSFTGDADNVRKAVMRWLAKRVIKVGCGISLEHAAYVGAELERCNTERIDYIQS